MKKLMTIGFAGLLALAMTTPSWSQAASGSKTTAPQKHSDTTKRAHKKAHKKGKKHWAPKVGKSTSAKPGNSTPAKKP